VGLTIKWVTGGLFLFRMQRYGFYLTCVRLHQFDFYFEIAGGKGASQTHIAAVYNRASSVAYEPNLYSHRGFVIRFLIYSLPRRSTHHRRTQT
jgi:hypothetical protein